MRGGEGLRRHISDLRLFRFQVSSTAKRRGSTWLVDEGEAAQVPVLLEDALEVAVLHAVPYVLHLAYHEVLHVHVVDAGAGGQQVGQVGQLLDQDDAVVERGLQQRRYGVGDQDRDLSHTPRHTPQSQRETKTQNGQQ